MNAHTPVPVPHVLLAKQVSSMDEREIRVMLDDHIDDADPAITHRHPTDIERATKFFVDACRHMLALHDRSMEVRGGFYDEAAEDEHERLAEARHNLMEIQQNLADFVEIQAIGDLGGRWVLRPGYRNLEVCRRDEDGAVLCIPRGLPQAAVRSVIEAYGVGSRDGGNRVRGTIANALVFE